MENEISEAELFVTCKAVTILTAALSSPDMWLNHFVLSIACNRWNYKKLSRSSSFATGFHLEPGGLVWWCLAEGAQTLKAFSDAVDVCQVHEEDLGIGIILGALHPSPSCPVTHCCCVASCINYQHLSNITKAGGSFSRKIFQARYLAETAPTAARLRPRDVSPVEGATIIGTRLSNGSDQLLVLPASPAKPADLRLGAPCQNSTIGSVSPDNSGYPPLRPELGNLLQDRVRYTRWQEDFLRVGGAQLVLLVGHWDPPSSLEVKPQPGKLTSEPGEIRALLLRSLWKLLVATLSRPGKVGKSKDILHLHGRRNLVQKPPAPFFCSARACKLDSVAASVLAIDVEVEKIPLLSRLHQAQRNVDEARAVDSQSFMVDIVKNYDVDVQQTPWNPTKRTSGDVGTLLILLCCFVCLHSVSHWWYWRDIKSDRCDIGLSENTGWTIMAHDYVYKDL